MKDLLPIIDNFERALKHVPKELEGNEYVKGIEGIVRQFEKTLADIGVERIKAVGEPFDPHLHEAVSMEAGDGKQEVVSEELQSGYRLGRRHHPPCHGPRERVAYLREHLTFRPDTPLRAAIISDAFATLSMGSDMESLFGNPNYPQQVAERIGWDMQWSG